jgi:hypothetical protein
MHKKIYKFFIILLVILSTIYLDLIIKIAARIPFSSINGLASAGDRILFASLIALIWYAWETKRIKEIGQEPILLLYIRKIKNLNEEKQKEQKEYATNFEIDEMIKDMDNTITPINNDYVLRIRNVGSGAAFNVRVENKNFNVEKYQAHFFAPGSDEQSIKLIGKNKNTWKPKEFNNEIFELKCNSINHKKHNFKFKIINFEKGEIDLIE